MGLSNWVTVAPTRTFPFGPWFHRLTALFLVLATLSIIAGAVLTVAWETLGFYRSSFNAKDDYWLRSFPGLKDEKLCEKENLKIGNTYYTTNGLFKWTVVGLLPGKIPTGKTPYDAGLSAYSGQSLRDTVEPPWSVNLKHHFATMETLFSMDSAYYPEGPLAGRGREGLGGILLQTQFTAADLSGAMTSTGRVQASTDTSAPRFSPLQKLQIYFELALKQLIQRPYIHVLSNRTWGVTSLDYSPAVFELEWTPGDRNSPGLPPGLDEDMFFSHLGIEKLADGSRVQFTSTPYRDANGSITRPSLPQWDKGLGYMMYSAALYDFGIDWPYSFMTNNTAAEKHLNMTLNDDLLALDPPPNAELSVQYRCTFKVLKSIPNAIFSVLTTLLSLMAGIWAAWKLGWEWWGARWHKKELEHFFTVPDPDKMGQPINVPATARTFTNDPRGSYSLASTVEK